MADLTHCFGVDFKNTTVTIPRIEDVIKHAGRSWRRFDPATNDVAKAMLSSRDLQDTDVGDAFAIPLDRTCVVPRAFDLLLGFYSDAAIQGHIEIGGSKIKHALNMSPNKPHPVIQTRDKSYALPMLEYHEIRVLGVPKHATLFAVGANLGQGAKQNFTTHIYRVEDMIIDRGMMMIYDFPCMPSME
jgi:hypothetical protein